MKNNNFIEYLYVTGQLDDTFDFKNILKCPVCNSELFIYEDNLLYCKKCDQFCTNRSRKKISNKTLTYIEKKDIRDRM